MLAHRTSTDWIRPRYSRVLTPAGRTACVQNAVAFCRTGEHSFTTPAKTMGATNRSNAVWGPTVRWIHNRQRAIAHPFGAPSASKTLSRFVEPVSSHSPPPPKQKAPRGRLLILAEAVRFELTDDLRHRRFSRPVHSTALPRFQNCLIFQILLDLQLALFAPVDRCIARLIHEARPFGTAFGAPNCSRQFGQPLCHASKTV